MLAQSNAALAKAKVALGSGFAPDISSPAARRWFAGHGAVIDGLMSNAGAFATKPAAGHLGTASLAKCSALKSAVSKAKSLPAYPGYCGSSAVGHRTL